MLGVGLDWAEAFHVVAIGRPQTGVTEVCRIDHTPAGLAGLIDHLRGLEPTAEGVRVVLETRHGLLVEALLAAGFTVLPVNSDLVARRRGPARKKDDVEDARICCLLAIDPHTQLKPLVAHSPVAAELRSIARDDARLAQDERRLLNRLRADLLATFPAALAIAGDDLGAPTILRMLMTWPTSRSLGTVPGAELADFARRGKHRYPERFATRVLDALAAQHLAVRDELARAKADTIRLTATHLLQLNSQRRAWERRMASSCSARPASAAPANHAAPGPTASLAARSTSAFPAWVIASPPGSRARSATTSATTSHRTRCNAMPAARPSPAAPAAANTSSPVGWPTTTSSARPSTSGRSAPCACRPGRGSSTPPNASAARATTAPCGRSATAGSRSSGTACTAACPTTKPPTPPTVTAPPDARPPDPAPHRQPRPGGLNRPRRGWDPAPSRVRPICWQHGSYRPGTSGVKGAPRPFGSACGAP